MNRKHLNTLGGLLIAGGAAVLLAATASAQAPAGWTTPRTADGHPDLQGNWTNVTITQLQRPEGAGPTLTPEQAAAMEKQVTDRVERLAQPSDPDRDAPPVGGDGSTGAAGMVGGYNNFWIDSGDSVARINGEYRSSLLVDPPNGRLPPLTAEARQRRAAAMAGRRPMGGIYDNPESRPLGERCIVSFGSNAGPPMVANGFYNNNYTIVQTKDHVMIMTEMVHDVRIIRLDGNVKRLPPHVRPWFGDSVGRWEGDTLVVETTNLELRQSFQGIGPNATIVERFTRIAPDQILYRFTVEDPETFTQPWSAEVPFNRLNELVYEYACHEGNYALANILSGARAQEKLNAATESR